MGPFVINVADLVNRPGARRRERVVGTLGGLRVGDASVPAENDVSVEVLLEWVTDGVLASGDTRARWVGDCRRCLGPVGGELRIEFRELFEPDPREGESYPLRNDHLDLAPLAREVLLLDLPLAPLCAADCRGLCPTCGADLNRGDCRCVAELGDPRWAALDVLRGDWGEAD
ncbi:MAG TPA: DUF177 domain-containing protein [Acidimicrobiales bacterium]|nr:DUF177 domain-containing protein [Acidimicrobiales bacterium]